MNVVIGGSPCQDLSVAGKRAGLDGARSGLFMEQIRIIKEMRLYNGAAYPRYMVWENVPGAFSSNKGEDFRVVLEETARVADQAAVIPRPPNGKWTNSGCVMADGWSIAWRVLDAQFWGVPQRRRRIALVADFGGQSAPEILFEQKSVCGDSAESGETRKRTTEGVKGSIGKAIGWYQNGSGECFVDDKAKTIQTNSNASGRGVQMVIEPTTYCIQGNSIDRADTTGCDGKGWREDISYTLNTMDRHAVLPFDTTQITSPQNGNNPHYGDPCHPLAAKAHPPTIAYCFDSLASNSMKSKNPHSGCREVNISKCIDTTNPDPSKNQGGIAIVYDARGNGNGEIVPTLTGDHGNRVTDYTALACFGVKGIGEYKEGVSTLRANGGDCGGGSETLVATLEQIGQTLDASYYKGCGSRSGKEREIIAQPPAYCVRRLTPLECSRLQGYPDNWAHIPGWKNPSKEDIAWWTEVHYEWGKMNSKTPDKVKRKAERAVKRWMADPTSDSAEYKAYGNSIAIPPWTYVLQRVSEFCGDRPTMASLFDGIGGFPLIFERINGRGSCLWASEVDPFAIAVTESRINNNT